MPPCLVLLEILCMYDASLCVAMVPVWKSAVHLCHLPLPFYLVQDGSLYLGVTRLVNPSPRKCLCWVLHWLWGIQTQVLKLVEHMLPLYPKVLVLKHFNFLKIVLKIRILYYKFMNCSGNVLK